MLLLHWGSYCWARNLFVLIIFFFLPVMLPFVLPRLASDSAASVSWCLETSLLKIPFQGWSFLPTSFVSFFVFYIFFLPIFEDNDLLFWVPDVLCQHSEVALWNLLNVEMFF